MVVMVTASVRIRMLKARVATCWGELESATWTVKLKLASTVGVPLMTPEELNVRSSGSGPEPEAELQVRVPVPPLACKVAL